MAGVHPLFDHVDDWHFLNRPGRLQQKLAQIHRLMKSVVPFVDRIAVALLDPRQEILKTFLSSQEAEQNLTHYECRLRDAPGLVEMLQHRQPRVVNDLQVYAGGAHRHTQVIRELGYRASYTLPILEQGQALGFLFINSHQTNVFTDENLELIDVYAHLIGLLVVNELKAILAMKASLKTVLEMVHFKDPETGNHLERMARYSRLIAKGLVETGQYPLSDEFIGYLEMFSPMHDIGKVGVPDRVLKKPGRLAQDELEIMKAHTTMGRQMVDRMVGHFGFESIEYIDLLRQVTESHHETLDGEGYPSGLSKEEIPLAARIVAVADIFDALTTERVYKPAWTNARAEETLRALSKTKLDGDCVDALFSDPTAIEAIQASLSDRCLELVVSSSSLR